MSCAKFSHPSFEACAVMMFQVEVFWVVTPCSVVLKHDLKFSFYMLNHFAS